MKLTRATIGLPTLLGRGAVHGPIASQPLDSFLASSAPDGTDGAREAIPLLQAQLGVWFASAAADPNGSTFSVGDCLSFDGPVNPDLLEVAHDLLSNEIEGSRLFFVDSGERPVQILGTTPAWPLRRVDCRADPDPATAAVRWIEGDMRSPVDLQSRPLFHAALLTLAADQHLYYRRSHHILLDGWSMDLLARRVADIYSDLSARQPVSTSPLGSLRTLLAEEAHYRGSARLRRDAEFWRAKLANAPHPVTLAVTPTPGPRGAQRVRAELGLPRITRLRAAAEGLGISWGEFALAATAAYILRLTGCTDFVLGLPVSGRMTKAGRSVPGMTANIIPLRLRCGSDITWPELATAIRSEVREATLHGRYRSEDLARDLGLVGSGRSVYGPVVNIMGFDHALTFAGMPARRGSVNGIGVEDISFTFWQSTSDSMELIVDANPRLYEPGQAEGHLTRLLAVIDAVIAAPSAQRVADLDLLDSAERDRLLAWSVARPTAPLPPDAPGADDADADLAARLFDRARQASPDAPAIEFRGLTISYRELGDRASQLALSLGRRGIGPGALVALAMPRSVDLVTAMIAVIKTGAAYLPLDPAYPSARLSFMMADAHPALLVISAAHPVQLSAPQQLVMGDGTAVEPAGGPRDGVPLGATAPEDPAYVIYTSGSSGSPKGVVVPHRGLASLLRLGRDCFRLGPGCRLLQFVSTSFDMSVADVWMTLMTGGTLVLADQEEIEPGPALEQFLTRQLITHVMLPPSTIQTLSPDHILDSTTIVVAGEECPPQVVAEWSPRCHLINAYGPTEASVYCAATEPLTRDQVRPVPIGRPTPGARLYVLDGRLRLVPAGEAGELYIGGVGVALGYLGLRDLTEARFVTDPHGPPGQRMYRSGDIVRWAPDGQLTFLHRNDDQVKVRGFRIELGEVEAALLRCPHVAAAAAAVQQSPTGDSQLVGCVIAADGASIDPATVREQLAEHLPAYLIPLIAVLDELPRTPSGKVDRRALPRPAMPAAGDGGTSASPAKKKLARMFADVLGISTPGPGDNFFDLGGDSLSAARLLGRINTAFGVRLTMRQFFASPTVTALASSLAHSARIRSENPIS